MPRKEKDIKITSLWGIEWGYNTPEPKFVELVVEVHPSCYIHRGYSRAGFNYLTRIPRSDPRGCLTKDAAIKYHMELEAEKAATAKQDLQHATDRIKALVDLENTFLGNAEKEGETND